MRHNFTICSRAIPLIAAFIFFFPSVASAAFASESPILIPGDKQRALRDFKVGDQVEACELRGKNREPYCEPTTVRFSSGTGAGGQVTLIKIILGDRREEVFATRASFFLLRDRRLKRASELVPGNDELLGRRGESIPIRALEVGKFEKGVHHISTSTAPTTHLDYHLIVLNGVLVADYSLQISESMRQQSPRYGKPFPEIGTKEYRR